VYSDKGYNPSKWHDAWVLYFHRHVLCEGGLSSYFSQAKISFHVSLKGKEIPPGTILKTNSQLSLYL
jgi:hypothetical protein